MHIAAVRCGRWLAVASAAAAFAVLAGAAPAASISATPARHLRVYGYVTAVDPDGGFDVSEYNFPPASGFQPFLFDRRHDVPVVRGVVFIDVPSARRPAAQRPLRRGRGRGLGRH